MRREEARRICMTCLYQKDILISNHMDYDLAFIIKENAAIDNEFIKKIVYGLDEKQAEIDALANKYLKDWDIHRLDKAGAAILRMAFYELEYMDTPPIVVINEAVELAKKYSDKDLAHMINAALDCYLKE